MIDLTDFAASVGEHGPVTVTGLGTRGGAVDGVRTVRAPGGIEWVQPDEMTVCCGASTPVDDLAAVLAEHGQTIALPRGGTVGGALSVGRSDVHRLGWGPVRDTLLQARVVSAQGRVVMVGGPTVKNVSGFDLCRLLVGARGTLGFLGEVVLRTRPLARSSQWFRRDGVDAAEVTDVFRSLYRPTSVLWDGRSVWALLEGHPDDVAAQASGAALAVCDGPPALPTGGRRSVSPSAVPALSGTFVAEVGVGIVHTVEAASAPSPDARVADLAAAVKASFDPTGRLNPGVMP